MSSAVLDDALPEREAATKLRYSAGHLARLRRQGRGPAHIRRGAAVYYQLADLEAYLVRREAGDR